MAPRRSVLVPMTVVAGVAMAVVDVVQMVVVLDGLVTAALAVLVVVVLLVMSPVVDRGHARFLSVPWSTASCTMCATCSSVRR